MRLLDNDGVPARGGAFPDRVELTWGADEIDGKAKLMLTLVIGESSATFEGADPGRLFERPLAKFHLKFAE